MPKLLKNEQFTDVSDYGRKPATFLAELVKETKVTPIHITYLFGICGLVAVYCIINQWYYMAAAFLVFKSILDAMDGELARLKSTPSYTGRYLDSIFDSVLNFLFLLAIGHITQAPFYLVLAAFICMQLQGTLYNYYYVIVRNRSEGGDSTSKIFEMKAPKALGREKQQTVNTLFFLFMLLYAPFDKTIYLLDNDAYKVKSFPNWFMTMVSVYGLGFQLLIIAVMLILELETYIIPFFITYSFLLFVFVTIRKVVVKDGKVS